MTDVIATCFFIPERGTLAEEAARHGTRAMHPAGEAWMEGLTLEEYAMDHAELARAIATWGVVHG
jgi:ribulose 1,5-bisphosphate carboxylase large subunit-like protein